MWMPGKWRRQNAELRADADDRLASAHAAQAQAAEAARRAEPVGARSRELAAVNGIAAAIAESLRPRQQGGNHHAPKGDLA